MTAQRKLRKGSKGPKERARVDAKGKMIEKIDRAVELEKTLKEKAAAYAQATKAITVELAELKKEVLGYLKENKFKAANGLTGCAQAKPNTKSMVHTEPFLRYLINAMRDADGNVTNEDKKAAFAEFLEVASVGVGAAKKAYGEKGLLAAGVLEVNTNLYGSVALSDKA